MPLISYRAPHSFAVTCWVNYCPFGDPQHKDPRTASALSTSPRCQRPGMFFFFHVSADQGLREFTEIPLQKSPL